MADSGIQASSVNPEALSEAAIPFRFEITWRSLTRPLKPTPREFAPPTARTPPPIDLSALTRRDPVSRPEPREWEMVLPKMNRPAALAPVASPEPDQPIAAPHFTFEPEPNLLRRIATIAGVALLITLGVATYQWLRRDTSAVAAGTSAQAETAGSGWMSEWASDAAGSARGRQLSLYRPSMSMSDYRFEFIGRIERRSLGWVFRAADSSNYYGAKVEAPYPGSGPLTISRFAVIRGVQGPLIQRTLSLAPGVGAIKVRLDARGPRFTVSVQNQVVDDWEDDRLRAGALGFLNEREERGQVGSIQISFPKSGVRQ